MLLAGVDLTSPNLLSAFGADDDDGDNHVDDDDDENAAYEEP